MAKTILLPGRQQKQGERLMKNQPLLSYLVILTLLGAGVIAGMKALGPQGVALVQVYMLTPAIAALIARLFFYKPKFSDANLRFGRLRDYPRFWLMAIGITLLSYAFYTLLGGITWDFSGQAFLDNLAQQFALSGQDINETLPPGFTPQMMLWLFFFGGLTVFNIFPGIITGFGEEFGHRGFMFPLLYAVKPWVGFIGGGLIWYAWHLPLAFALPQTNDYAAGQALLNTAILAVGSIFTFTFLTYVYIKSRSIFVVSFTHIVLNNAAASFAYFVIVQDQLLANLGLMLTMMVVVAVLYFRKEFMVFDEYFA
ncbi:MAG TPA: CPBP family intramembrane metalloprotease [Anaerolineae bacterium]|nr:CPBP family intramembrane metalloprotease [Anaerolineae bacterium]